MDAMDFDISRMEHGDTSLHPYASGFDYFSGLDDEPVLEEQPPDQLLASNVASLSDSFDLNSAFGLDALLNFDPAIDFSQDDSDQFSWDRNEFLVTDTMYNNGEGGLFQDSDALSSQSTESCLSPTLLSHHTSPLSPSTTASSMPTPMTDPQSPPSRGSQGAEASIKSNGRSQTKTRNHPCNPSKKEQRKKDKPEICTVCKRGCATTRELKRHYNVHHKLEAKNLGVFKPRIPCKYPYCLETFARPDHRTRHLKNKHAG